MTTEEKARRYDEALSKAKDVYTYYCDDREQLRKIESIFPELKQSEDEKIRKSLIDMLKNDEKCYLKEIAWLEKQGEQKPITDIPSKEVIFSIWDLGNEWKELTKGCILEKYGTQLDYIQKHWHESDYCRQQVKKSPSEIKTVGESLNITTQKECDDYNRIVTNLIMNNNTEDEKIRKALISVLKSDFEKDTTIYDISVGDIITWLEKQNKENPLKNTLGNVFDDLRAGLDPSPTQNEQKSVAEVEPKFNIGAWIVSDLEDVNEDFRLCKIIDIKDGCYTIKSANGGEGYNFFEIWESDYHLWSIKDAKEGDVLIDKPNNGEEYPFIFKETKPSNIKTNVPNPLTVLGYCGIGGAGFTKGNIGCGDTANCTYYPATKEQCDALFQKMKEEGYKWDVNNKRLIIL